jgi:UDPglucose--hexose-1-phosphate uridylyltransferase
MSELRWNPLLGEWLVTATHRQERTFLPPADFCPLCPTKDPLVPTEVPDSVYDIAVFENRFPSLQQRPEAPAIDASDLYPVQPARGLCEVVLYSPNHHVSLAQESVGHLASVPSLIVLGCGALSLEVTRYMEP